MENPVFFKVGDHPQWCLSRGLTVNPLEAESGYNPCVMTFLVLPAGVKAKD